MKNSTLILILFSFAIFHSCEEEKKILPAKNDVVTQTTKIEKAPITEIKDDEISIQIEKIDSAEFYTVKENINYKPEKSERITDLKVARKMLKGRVEFTSYDGQTEMNLIKQINFRNGKILTNTDEFSESSFAAYFPKDDILLLEGGHTTDVSYNLTNGDETENASNPDMISTSPQKKFRLNGHFGGQECSSYFIQKKVGEDYRKIIQLDKEFEKITKIWLCIVGKSFWSDEKTLYLIESSDFTEDGVKNKYFKIILQNEWESDNVPKNE